MVLNLVIYCIPINKYIQVHRKNPLVLTLSNSTLWYGINLASSAALTYKKKSKCLLGMIYLLCYKRDTMSLKRPLSCYFLSGPLQRPSIRVAFFRFLEFLKFLDFCSRKVNQFKGQTDANICSLVFTFGRTIISQLVGYVSPMFYIQ